MFWRTEAAFQTSTLANILDRPDVTLTEIMDDEYILQEIKYGNKRLIDLLIKEENLVAVTKLCVTEPPNLGDEQKKYKYSHLASEILSAGSDVLTEALAKSEECFNILANFVSRSSDDGSHKPLNPLLASFFNKVFSLLTARHTDRVLSYTQAHPEFLDNLIQNLDVSALAESLFRLACGGDDDKHARAAKMWLADRGFLQKLICQLDPSTSDEKHQNVTFLLCELIRALRRDQFARDDNPLVEEYVDPLVAALESRPVLDDLLDRVLAGKDAFKYSDSVTSNGCAIFITLLQTVLNAKNPINFIDELGKYDPDPTKAAKDDDFARIACANRPAGVMWEPDVHRITENTLATGLPRLKMLLEDGKKEPMLLPMGHVEAPLGTARLALTQLLAQLLSNRHPKVHEEVARLDLMRDLITLFFKHKWNNFLHTNVVNCFICALFVQLDGEGKQYFEETPTGDVDDFDEHSESKRLSYASPLLKQILETHHVLKLIVETVKESLRLEEGSKNGNQVPPYIGHVMRLGACTYYAVRDGPNAAVMKESFEKLPAEERQAWNEFVDVHLQPYIMRNEPDQMGTLPSRDDGGLLTDQTEDFSGSDAPGKDFRSLAARAQTGYSLDDVFSSNPQVTAADFLKDEPMDESAFEAECNKRTSSIGDDEWAEKEITFERSTDPDNAGPASVDLRKEATKKRSSSSDEDEKMEVDKDAEPPEWFSTTDSSKKSLTSDNWASFDDEWPSSNSEPDTGVKPVENVPSSQSDWANFDQKETNHTENAFGEAFAKDPWANSNTSKGKQGSSTEWGPFSQSSRAPKGGNVQQGSI